jgi:RNA polymerase sigma factor (TIGR02999 family)
MAMVLRPGRGRRDGVKSAAGVTFGLSEILALQASSLLKGSFTTALRPWLFNAAPAALESRNCQVTQADKRLMSSSPSQNLTQMLVAWGQGDEAARDALIPVVYEHLRRIARHHLRGERAEHTLQTSALINEAYLKLVDQTVSWQDRNHFFGIAARLMRQILVDHARARQRLKRGGDQYQISLTAAESEGQQARDLLALNEALESLAKIDPLRSQIVELRFFGGLTIEEAAQVMRISTPTVERGWRAARAWLQTELG